jgi:predicted TIM-barrel fold metal-dependent hydrolase
MAILDAHTHLAGSESGESAESILSCLDASGVEKAFVFAPLVDVRSYQLANEHFDDIRTHNDYCADLCSADPERLIAFCVLNPSPRLASGSLDQAVDLMIDEARRCFHELGLRGVKMVPSGWYPSDPPLTRLYRELADLGMYVVFHAGIFLDGREGMYCRPAFFEAVHEVAELKVQLAHVGWPWVEECLAVLNMQRFVRGQDPKKWQIISDVSFGPPDDFQLPTWQTAIDTLPPDALCYGSDIFWPSEPAKYQETFLKPQLGLFEVAVTQGHHAPEGSSQRIRLREQIFFENAWSHWERAVREPQRPRAAKKKIATRRAKTGR